MGKRERNSMLLRELRVRLDPSLVGFALVIIVVALIVFLVIRPPATSRPPATHLYSSTPTPNNQR